MSSTTPQHLVILVDPISRTESRNRTSQNTESAILPILTPLFPVSIEEKPMESVGQNLNIRDTSFESSTSLISPILPINSSKLTKPFSLEKTSIIKEQSSGMVSSISLIKSYQIAPTSVSGQTIRDENGLLRFISLRTTIVTQVHR